MLEEPGEEGAVGTGEAALRCSSFAYPMDRRRWPSSSDNFKEAPEIVHTFYMKKLRQAGEMAQAVKACHASRRTYLSSMPRAYKEPSSVS